MVFSNMAKRKFMPLMELSKLASKIKAKKQLGRGWYNRNVLGIGWFKCNVVLLRNFFIDFHHAIEAD